MDGKTYSLTFACELLPNQQYVETLKSELHAKLQKLGMKETTTIGGAFLELSLGCSDVTKYYGEKFKKISSAKFVDGKSKITTLSTQQTPQGLIVSEFDGETLKKVETKSLQDKILRLRFHVLNQLHKKFAEVVIDYSGTFVPSADFLTTSWPQLIADFLEPLNHIEFSEAKLKELCAPRFGFEFDKDNRHVKRVPAKTPAAKAGLKKGDEVIRIQSVPSQEFYEKLSKETFENGKLVPMEILRNGKPMILGITPAQVCIKL